MADKRNIDMLRFYGGDIRKRTEDGKFLTMNSLKNPRDQKDLLWVDENAYRTLNALLFDGYENEKEGVLIPKTITEKIILEIPVDISQMSVFECKKPCQKVRIDRENISKQEITLICGEECEDRNNSNAERRCNFLCQWFCVKNDYLIRELAALKEYLKRNQNNYFQCEIEIRIKCNEKTSIDVRQFEVLKNYIQKKNING